MRKFRFFTSHDESVWINKQDLLNYIGMLRKTKWTKELLKEIEKCYYVD